VIHGVGRRGGRPAPRPLRSAADEARADGIRPDVLEGRVVVLLVPDHPRGEAFGEQGSTASVARVVLAGVRAVGDVHGAGQVLRAPFDDRVVVRPHQAVGVDRQRRASCGGRQQGEEEQPVFIRPEEDGLVDGPGGDMEEPVRKRGTKTPGHASTVGRPAARQARSTHFRPTSDTPPRASTGV
jgi:hypothetical protein